MRAEPWGLVRTDHGSSTIRCTPNNYNDKYLVLIIVLILRIEKSTSQLQHVLIINRAMQCTSVDTNIIMVIAIFIVIFIGVSVPLTWGKDSSEPLLTLVYETALTLNCGAKDIQYSTVQCQTV